jgi:catecholate siderophore receptor
MNNVHLQSDYSGRFNALGLSHQLLAGADLTREKKTVYAARNASNGGVNITKPTTTFGTPSDGSSVDEASRVLRLNNNYLSTGWGAYVQDTLSLSPSWKLVGGLRYDDLKGDYTTFTTESSSPFSVTPSADYQMKISEFSYRGGVLHQPDDRTSYHFSIGTSFNTSGDAYSLGASNADTPPEKSRNIELGAKLDSADGRLTSRYAVFHSTKYNERNTDPDLPIVTLSGQRHVAGFEMDFAGRITPKWEVFASYTWMPMAKVDRAAPCPASGQCSQGTIGERPGDRPALTPHYTGSVWSTYQVTPKVRFGGGLTLRGKQRPTRVAFHVPSFVTADVMAEYQAIPEKLVFKANITNLTNELYADQLYPAHYVPGQGRTFQLTTTLKF